MELANLANSPLGYVVVGLVSLLFGWLVKGSKAPKWLKKYLDKVIEGNTIQTILFGLVEQAETFKDMTGEAKKAWVSDKLYTIAHPYIGPIAKPILDSLIEWVFQSWAKKNKK